MKRCKRLDLFQTNPIFLSTRSILWPYNMLKCVGSRGSTLDPTWGDQDTLPDPLIGWGGGHPLLYPNPSVPAVLVSRLNLSRTTFRNVSVPLLTGPSIHRDTGQLFGCCCFLLLVQSELNNGVQQCAEPIFLIL